MDSILQQITDWLKEMLVEAIMGNLSGLFDSVNNQVGEIASDVGMTPANFSPGVFAMIRNISENVIIPIAGLILTFIVCHELIQLIIDHNNLANFETWIFFKWVFKTFVAVMLITNTFNITMAVFDVSQHVVNASAGIISGSTAVDASALETMEETLNAMELGPLLGLFLQSFIVQVTMSMPCMRNTRKIVPMLPPIRFPVGDRSRLLRKNMQLQRLEKAQPVLLRQHRKMLARQQRKRRMSPRS